MLMMMTGNLVGFAIGTDGVKYLAGEIIGRWYGTFSGSHWSHTLADPDCRLAIFRCGVWGVVYRRAIHVRIQRGRDASWNIPKILKTVLISFRPPMNKRSREIQ